MKPLERLPDDVLYMLAEAGRNGGPVYSLNDAALFALNAYREKHVKGLVEAADLAEAIVRHHNETVAEMLRVEVAQFDRGEA